MFFNRVPERTYTSHANQVKMLDKIKDSCKNSDVLFQKPFGLVERSVRYLFCPSFFEI